MNKMVSKKVLRAVVDSVLGITLILVLQSAGFEVLGARSSKKDNCFWIKVRPIRKRGGAGK